MSQGQAGWPGGSEEKLVPVPGVMPGEKQPRSPSPSSDQPVYPEGSPGGGAADRVLGDPDGGLPFRLLSQPPALPRPTPATEIGRSRSLPRMIAPLRPLPAWHCPQASRSWQP